MKTKVKWNRHCRNYRDAIMVILKLHENIKTGEGLVVSVCGAQNLFIYHGNGNWSCEGEKQ